MIAAVLTLVLARLRHRAGVALLSVAVVAAAAALVAFVSGIGLISADATLDRALASTGADRPVVRVSHFSHSSRDAGATSATAEESLAGVDAYAGPVIRGMLVRQLVDLDAPMVDQLVALDDPAPWTSVIEGRLPATCIGGTRCEALLVSETPLADVRAARPAPGMELTIVGRGLLDQAVPFGILDQRGPLGERPAGGQYQTADLRPAILLVVGVDALAASPALDEIGRTYVWTAPVDARAIHPWTATAFAAAVDATVVNLTREDSAFSVTSPTGLISAELGRAAAARGRLVLIESLGVAILLAFSVFLSLVARDDVAAETARLTAAGALRRDRLAFLAVEAVVPTVGGGALGWLLGGVVVGSLAAWSGSDVGAVVGGALLGAESVLAAFAVLLAMVSAIVAVMAPGLRRRDTVPVLGAIGLTTVALLGWQLVSSGSLGPGILGTSLANPVVVLLPPMVAFLLALAFLLVLPPALRAFTRRIRRAPLSIRLSLLSVSRTPARPAATLTLLAFSLGAIVFAIGWSASLRQGIDDAAAYRSGLDLRVHELGTALSISPSVVPVGRYAALGDDLTLVPVYRDTTQPQQGGRVDIVGISPAALATLPSWRTDFSAVPQTELAERLAVEAPPGGWRTSGHRLPAGNPQLTVRFRYEGDPLKLDAIVATDGGDTTSIPLGIVSNGMTSASAPLPQGARGGQLTALIFRHDRMIQGSGHQHQVRRATVAFDGLTGLVDGTPVDLEVFTVSTVIIRAPQATDGMVLPAIVSPDLAATADADGSLALQVANDAVIQLRVVATATRIPSVVEPAPRFVMVPLDPFLVAFASAVPGSGRPSEMWIGGPSSERLAEVRAALAEPPFRFAQVTARSDLIAQRSGDPISQSIVWALVAAALTGLALSVGGLILGAVTDLRDEHGELADLEAQGVPPSVLRWHAFARTAWLTVGGGLAGLAVGIVLAMLATAVLALTAEGTTPIPPLVVVLPLVPIAAAVTGVVGAALAIVAFLAARTFGRATLGERRTPGGTTTTSPWQTTPERLDG